MFDKAMRRSLRSRIRESTDSNAKSRRMSLVFITVSSKTCDLTLLSAFSLGQVDWDWLLSYLDALSEVPQHHN